MEPLRAGDPRTVGPYVLIARLGAGGMGQVFLGRTRGGRTVAVKVVKAELAGDREFRRRFRQEVAAARLVSGRYTAAVVDADPEAATPWLATAYVSGLTLRAVVGAGALLPETSLRVLAYGLARALAEIHTAGVVHRDLKPSNVMLAVDGPHVIDFGISRVIAATDLTRTDVGTIVGSPGFMSPEQTRGHELTARDRRLLARHRPRLRRHRPATPSARGPDHALLYRIAHDEPDLSGVPDSLAPLIAMCLAKDPAQRPSTAQIIGRMADSVPEGAWLPADLTAAIAQSAAEILDYEGIAVFPQPDNDPATAAHPAAHARTRPDAAVCPRPATTRRHGSAWSPAERTARTDRRRRAARTRKRGADGAGLVAGLLSVAVIAALGDGSGAGIAQRRPQSRDSPGGIGGDEFEPNPRSRGPRPTRRRHRPLRPRRRRRPAPRQSRRPPRQRQARPAHPARRRALPRPAHRARPRRARRAAPRVPPRAPSSSPSTTHSSRHSRLARLRATAERSARGVLSAAR